MSEEGKKYPVINYGEFIQEVSFGSSYRGYIKLAEDMYLLVMPKKRGYIVLCWRVWEV